MEAMALQAASTGDYKSAHRILCEILSGKKYDIGTMAYSQLKQAEYFAVLCVGQFCRATIQGGVDPLLVYDKSDLFLLRISEIHTIKEYEAVIDEALLALCKMVNDCKAKKIQSLHIKRCKQYIYQHINVSFSLNDIAKSLQINPTYLSGIFHKYEAVTIKQYILGERIKLAENLLKYSNYSIADIAHQLCFSTSTHFGQTFKKHTGSTPSQYRTLNMPVSFQRGLE